MRERRDLPLLHWAEQLKRDTGRRRKLRRRGLAGLAGIALILATTVVPPSPRLVWNVSPSAPVGLYRVIPGGALERGDMVVARLPERWRRLAAERHYLPSNVPLVKAVAAIPGDEVCAVGESLYVNGRWAVHRLESDGQGRSMPMWQGCATLGPSQYLLLMAAAPASFDGRYFGPVEAELIVGRAVPLWVR